MEPITTQFNLEQEIARWQLTFADSTLTADDLTELAEHLRDEIDHLKEQNLTEQEAWLVARHRIGTQQDIDQEFSKVNPDFTGARHWVMLFWGAALFMLLQTLVFIIPNMLKYIGVNKPNQLNGGIKGWISYSGLTELTYVLSGAIFLLAVIVFIKPAKAGTWFNNVLCKYGEVLSLLLIPAGLLTGFFSFNIFAANLLKGYTGSYPTELQNAVSLLGTILYGSLIAGTVYLTLRYRAKESLFFRNFTKDLRWTTAALLGVFLQLIINYTYNAHSDVFTAIVIGIVFSAAGMLAGSSKNLKANFVAIQFGALTNYTFAFYINHEARLLFMSDYLITLFVLGVSTFIRYKQMQTLQTA